VGCAAVTPTLPSTVPPKAAAQRVGQSHDTGATDASAGDRELKGLRLEQFLRWMLPIAMGFLAAYVGLAVVWRSAALAIGAVAVFVYAVALAISRGLARRKEIAKAALVSGVALQLMLAIGAVGLRYQFAALLLISLAGVALVLPFLGGRALRNYMLFAMLMGCWIVAVDFVFDPGFEQPPRWFQLLSLSTAVIAAFGLTLRMLWVDATRLRLLLDRANEAVRLREEFLAVASHELNTPLTPLALKLDALAKAAAKSSDQPFASVVAGHVDGSRKQVRRLARLVGDLLDVTRLEAGRLSVRPEPMDLVELTRSVVTRYEPQAQAAGSAVALETPHARVEGQWDPARLEQILDNLLSNAIKYGHGKPIHVQVTNGVEHAVVAVKDFGIGVPREAQARIFERFERAVSAANYGGLGLGLYISRNLAWSMGGELSVESQPGVETTFTLKLPVAAATASQSA
jgi:signal transduction histidine kinase